MGYGCAVTVTQMLSLDLKPGVQQIAMWITEMKIYINPCPGYYIDQSADSKVEFDGRYIYSEWYIRIFLHKMPKKPSRLCLYSKKFWLVHYTSLTEFQGAILEIKLVEMTWNCLDF